MTDEFDPYLKWLAIPKSEQPANHYRLLGLPLFMDEPDVIENAADQRMGHLRTFGSGKYSKFSQRILNEVAAAKLCLLSPEKRQAYDAELRAELRANDSTDNQALRPESAAVETQPQPLPMTPPTRPMPQRSNFTSPLPPPSFPSDTLAQPLPEFTPNPIQPARSKSDGPPVWLKPVMAIAVLAALGAATLVAIAVVLNLPSSNDLASNDDSPARSEERTEPLVSPSLPTPKPPRNPPPTPDTASEIKPPEENSVAAPDPPVAEPLPLKPTPIAKEPEPTTPTAPSNPPVDVTPIASSTIPAEAGEFALEIPADDVLVIQRTANETALDRQFTIETWLRWPADRINGMQLLGNRARSRDSRLGEWNLWFTAPDDKPEGQVALQYFLNEKRHHEMGARPKVDSDRGWHHVAFSRAADRYWLSFDGKIVLEEELQVEPSSSRAEDGDFYLGSRGLFNHNKGRGLQISALRVSQGARYQKEFTPPPNFEVDADSLSVLDFSHRSNGRVIDLSPHQRHGVFEKCQWVDLSKSPSD